MPREIRGAWTGSLTIEGEPASNVRPGTRVGLVFQDPSRQLVMDRAGDDVAFGLENLGWPREAMRERVPTALALVGLAGAADRVALELSGGQLHERPSLGGTPDIL